MKEKHNACLLNINNSIKEKERRKTREIINVRNPNALNEKRKKKVRKIRKIAKGRILEDLRKIEFIYLC